MTNVARTTPEVSVLRRLLGDHLAAFEEAITDANLAIKSTGQFTEPVSAEVMAATRGVIRPGRLGGT